MILVTSLFEMPHWVRELGPSHLVSIIQPEFQPPTPPQIAQHLHHRVQVHDISEPQDGSVHPDMHHIESLVEFIDTWPVEDPLLVHCYAGISRSTAVALIGLAMKTRTEIEAARALRAASPHAMPNRLIISLADQVLGLDGRLVAAREAMGESDMSRVGDDIAPLTTVGLGDVKIVPEQSK